jgi:hypothetical protein
MPWSEVTVLAKDATVEIVGLVRDVIEIAHIESVRMLPGTLRGSFHD